MMKCSHATPDATANYFKRLFGADSAHICEPLADTKILVSTLGAGAYRMSGDYENHDTVLREAIISGVNLIDASANYMDGDAEILIGDVLAKLFREREVDRGEIIICSKAGYIQGKNYSRLLSLSEKGKAFPEIVKYEAGLWHCIHPDFLEDQIHASRQRLRVDCIDIFLLHNPEYFLIDALKKQSHSGPEAFKIFYDRIYRAFLFLEKAVESGWIQYYGVSSNSLPGDPGRRDFVDVSRLWEMYNRVCAETGIPADRGHFKVLQFPFNWLEPEALTLKNTQATDAPETVLDFCQKNSLACFVNRPLNAIVRNQMFRIARKDFDPAKDYLSEIELKSDQLGVTLDALGQLFTTSMQSNASAQMNSLLKKMDLGKSLKSTIANCASADELKYIWERRFYPIIQGSGGAILQNAPDSLQTEARELLIAYAASANEIMTLAAANISRRQYELFREFDQAFANMGPARQTLSLSEKALLFAKSPRGITSVLNGMRRHDYVAEALRVLKSAKLDSAELQKLLAQKKSP